VDFRSNQDSSCQDLVGVLATNQARHGTRLNAVPQAGKDAADHGIFRGSEPPEPPCTWRNPFRRIGKTFSHSTRQDPFGRVLPVPSMEVIGLKRDHLQVLCRLSRWSGLAPAVHTTKAVSICAWTRR
jgi:hypothetical protein